MLTLTLLCVGRLKAGAERELATRYLDRAAAAGRALGLAVECREISESHARRPTARKADEADAILKIADVSEIVAFDEAGRSLDSQDFADALRRALDASVGRLTFVIGGPDGLDASVLAAASRVVALGRLTWPHQLARVMVAEQIYRAVTILNGHPYHRS